MIESRKAENCYYCKNIGEYTQLVGSESHGYAVAYVCKDHLNMGLSA